MRLLGNKVAARNLAVSCGAPVMPATDPLPDDPEEILRLQKLVNQVYIDAQVKRYIIRLVVATREGEKVQAGLGRMIRCGASPRATIHCR